VRSVALRAERRRVARAIQAALIAAGSPAIVVACSSSGAPPAPTPAPHDGGSAIADATVDTGVDAAKPAKDSASPPVDAAPAIDTGPPPPGVDAASCYFGSFEVDAGPDADAAGDICGYVYGCGLAGQGLGVSGCQVLQITLDGGLAPLPGLTCWLQQDAGCDDDAFAPEDGGEVTVLCTPCPAGGGRRPAGVVAPRGSSRAKGRDAVGAYLAALAFEEEVSVVAFARMRAELAALGAPAEIVAASERAERDEERHARVMRRAAAVRGGQVGRARVRSSRRRTAAAIAAENAAEGCVRETYGALVARWQASRAGDAGLRRAFDRIATDESNHAALSWAVARWLEPRLSPPERRSVTRARTRALGRLRAQVALEPDASLACTLGLPSASEARSLLDTLSRELGLR
jgi:hypothetical protein